MADELCDEPPGGSGTLQSASIASGLRHIVKAVDGRLEVFCGLSRHFGG